MSELKELLSFQKIDVLRGETTILRDVTLNLHNAELVFILGASGSGKSSFLKSVYGALEIQGNYSRVLGYDLTSIKRSELQFLRRKLGLVFQDFKIFEKLTVFENLNYFLRSINIKNEEAIRVILDKVGLGHKTDKRGFELSGGEKQRLAVARALVHKPQIILADEPTGNLNKTMGIEIFKLLRDLAIDQGSSIIAATHDEALTSIFSAKVFLCENQRFTRI
ncbi:cell division ATP-binding protein FtsE [Portibacter lacus]|uniref:Phosphonate ABC transporter ATP-binding protein n=1 Tax=Portibacter lacus TaxID=1099794 RepID=A0AA37WCF3_9BACT|nr:ATP-binding cassette domain-containing protein [Portibacter lacus]GLR16451.1 phosphonate ABC transporter ATP-binding protein [Portibacter lacus]